MHQARVLTVHEACQAHHARGWLRDQKCRGPRVRSPWSFAWGLAGQSPLGTSAFNSTTTDALLPSPRLQSTGGGKQELKTIGAILETIQLEDCGTCQCWNDHLSVASAIKSQTCRQGSCCQVGAPSREGEMANREGEALRQAEPKGAEAKARGHR